MFKINPAQPRQLLTLLTTNEVNKVGPLIEMKKVKKELFIDALITAYCEVAPKKLAEKMNDLRSRL